MVTLFSSFKFLALVLCALTSLANKNQSTPSTGSNLSRRTVVNTLKTDAAESISKLLYKLLEGPVG